MRPGRTIRRLSVFLIIPLMLGAVTTVASTVLLALHAPLGRIQQKDTACCATWASTGRMAIFMIFGASSRGYLAFHFMLPISSEHGEFTQRDWNPPIGPFMPSWALVYAYEYWGPTLIRMSPRIIEAHGWPLPAAYSVSDLSQTGMASRPPGLTVSATTGRPVARFSHLRPFFVAPFEAVIPLQPIWRGIALDTAAFSAVYVLLAALFLAPFRIRRFLRLRRGLCPACGYDLAGNTSGVCPECGRPA